MPGADRHSGDVKGIGGTRDRPAERRATTPEAGGFDVGAVGFGQVVRRAEGIGERFHPRAERRLEILPRAGDFELRVASRYRAEIDVSAGVRTDLEAALLQRFDFIPV